MRTFLTPILLAALALGLAACTANEEESHAVSALTLTGRIDAASFASAVSAVQVLNGGGVIAEAPVGADGQFAVVVPAGSQYRIGLVYGEAMSTLVFPRQSGAIEVNFDVLGAGSFDLGAIHHIGALTGRSFQFSPLANKNGDGDSDDDEYECEDGVDPTTGAVCIDDDEDGNASQCGSDEDENEDEDDDDDMNCEDGIDPATGDECDGGPAANADDEIEGDDDEGDEIEGDDEGDDDEGENDDDNVPDDAAVADHNLPTSLGCPGEDEDGGVDCENGIDTATGLECDGGPEANHQD